MTCCAIVSQPGGFYGQCGWSLEDVQTSPKVRRLQLGCVYSSGDRLGPRKITARVRTAQVVREIWQVTERARDSLRRLVHFWMGLLPAE